MNVFNESISRSKNTLDCFCCDPNDNRNKHHVAHTNDIAMMTTRTNATITHSSDCIEFYHFMHVLLLQFMHKQISVCGICFKNSIIRHNNHNLINMCTSIDSRHTLYATLFVFLFSLIVLQNYVFWYPNLK